MARKIIDWEGIEKEYRAGQLSIREIARQNNISPAYIVKKAKENEWLRDLTPKVKQLVNSRLVNDGVNSINEKDIVEQAADRAIKIIQVQRNDIKQAIVSCEKLFTEMEEQTTRPIAIGKGKDRKIVEIDVTAIEKASPFFSLTAALKNLVLLQRQAYNIDQSPTGSEDDPIHFRHSMDTKGLTRALEPRRVGPLQIEEG